MTHSERSPDEVAQALAAEFPPGTVKFKPGMVSGNRALALAYVDARVVQDRLDEVLGVMGWQDTYEVFPDGSVMCRLSVKIGGEWICKMDVGGQSEQPDEGDRRKAAVSDALKRAAVKFGVGRYLYRLKAQWLDYDVAKRRFVKEPSATRPAQAAPAVQAAPAAPTLPPKLTAEQVEGELTGWRKWLETKPDRLAVNETVRADLPGAPREVKKTQWDMVAAYARERGWGAWSAQENGFTEAREKVTA